MPTFTAFALERLLEPGSTNPSPKPPPASITVDRAAREKRTKQTFPRPNISPALYATPESTPLPDSPSSFSSESPYLINHKIRGPRVMKKLLANDAVGGQPSAQKVESVKENGLDTVEHKADDEHKSSEASSTDTVGNGQSANSDRGMIGAAELKKPVSNDPERDEDTDDFFDTQSLTSNSDVDDSTSRLKPNTPLGNYYDALEEISSDDTPLSTFRDFDDELYEMKLNLLMEMQKRKHAEESLEKLQNLWQRLSHHLSLLGLSLPPPTVSEGIDMQFNLDLVEELSQQVVVSRFVADAIGRGCARAEIELEMEPQIASKNFEIARLSDRLQYYEAANKEMSQRNQETIEMARQQRYRRKRRQKWIWSSVCLAITIGGAAISWSYLPSSKPILPEADDAATGHEIESE